tara:strand:+ start:14627 stop:17398 length:2772 start_codon:yes stop_codon:yes gene_type:complete
MSEFRSKLVKIFDPTLMSGSVDTFRTTIGAGLVVTKDPHPRNRYGTYLVRETDKSRQKRILKNQDINKANKSKDTYQPPKDPTSNALIRNVASLATANVGTLDAIRYDSANAVPVIRYSGRIYGDADKIENDMQWDAFINGGVYMDTEYDGMFMDAEYFDHWYKYEMPYTSLEVEELKQRFKQIPIMDEINVGYEYNRFMKKYERYAGNLPDEKLIPNLYTLQMFSEADDIEEVRLKRFFKQEDINAVSRYKLPKSEWSDLLKDETDFENEENFSIREKRQFNKNRRHRMRKYLNFDVPKNPLRFEDEQAIMEKSNNILFDAHAMATVFQTAIPNKSLFPYYAKISFEASKTGYFCESFRQNNFSGKLLVALKEVFGTNPTYFQPDENQFVAQFGERIKRRNINKVGTVDVRLADLGVMLNEARLRYINTKSDWCFMGRQSSLPRQSAYDTDGNYRFHNNRSATKVLLDFLDFADESKYLNEIKEPFHDDTSAGKYTETIAYRVEKIGGPPTGDSNTQRVIQNFWFSNCNALTNRTPDSSKQKDFDFCDTQVKYGEEYTYKVYAYVVTAGSRYELSDHRITRVIAKLDEGEDGAQKPLYCLEFYDPLTGETRPALYKGEGSGDVAVNNDFMTTSQLANVNKYLADFNVTVQPSIKVVEMPLTSKTIKILDAPPNTAQALPFPVEDGSNRIGYDIEYTATDNKQFPPAISEADDNYRKDYMFSNNLLPKTPIDKGSISYPRFLQVYRTDKPPQKFSDFDGKLIKTVDLKIENSQHTLKEYICYDKIETNKDYYYVFRFVNEHGNPGRPSVIHKATLVDDGGYNYPIFDIYNFATAAEKRKSAKTRDSFKKILDIRPSYQHLVIDESSYKTSDSSSKVLNKLKIGLADSPIWNKKFKLRLTSKKTGKKLDVNITYNLKREYNRGE